jgi:hypothetical protein
MHSPAARNASLQGASAARLPTALAVLTTTTVGYRGDSSLAITGSDPAACRAGAAEGRPASMARVDDASSITPRAPCQPVSHVQQAGVSALSRLICNPARPAQCMMCVGLRALSACTSQHQVSNLDQCPPVNADQAIPPLPPHLGCLAGWLTHQVQQAGAVANTVLLGELLPGARHEQGRGKGGMALVTSLLEQSGCGGQSMAKLVHLSPAAHGPPVGLHHTRPVGRP